jgi:hypothetical protein
MSLFNSPSIKAALMEAARRKSQSAGAQLQTALGSNRSAADQATNAYLDKATNFDAGESFKEFAGGAYGEFQTNLGKELKNLAGRSVGAGRLDTGFFDEDQGEVITSLGRDFQNTIAQGALQTAGLNQQNIAGLGNFGNERNDQYLSLLSGQLDREQAEKNAKRARKGALAGGLLKFAGAGIGFLAGGPIGAGIGAKLGGMAGAGDVNDYGMV